MRGTDGRLGRWVDRSTPEAVPASSPKHWPGRLPMTISIRVLRLMGVDAVVLEARQWRRQHGLRQRDVSRLLGWSPERTCNLELGIRKPKPAERRALVRLMQTAPNPIRFA